jgi:hypothetical protein
MKAKLATIAMALWIVTIGALVFFFVHGWTSKGADQRTAIHLAPAERDLVLTEMRQMLNSVHGLVTGLSDGNREAMEQASRASGIGMAADVNPLIMAKLPLEFKQLGMSVHEEFDKLAETIAKGADSATILRGLSGITARCVGCHAAYRLP